jgi:hypothetical protein
MQQWPLRAHPSSPSSCCEDSKRTENSVRRWCEQCKFYKIKITEFKILHCNLWPNERQLQNANVAHGSSKLLRGKVLVRVFTLRSEISLFISDPQFSFHHACVVMCDSRGWHTRQTFYKDKWTESYSKYDYHSYLATWRKSSPSHAK